MQHHTVQYTEPVVCSYTAHTATKIKQKATDRQHCNRKDWNDCAFTDQHVV